MKKRYVIFICCILFIVLSLGFISLGQEATRESSAVEMESTESMKKEAEKEVEKKVEDVQAKETPAEETEIVSQADDLAGEAQIQKPGTSETMPSTYIGIEELQPGDVIERNQMADDVSQYFKMYEITEGDAVYNRIIGKSYRENDHVALSDLRYIKMPHYNFQHQIQIGEMITNVAIADSVLKIFQELFEIEYEIQSMYLIDNYWTGDGDSSDSASIDVNNTSCFCYREVTGGTNLSNHAYGCAIDLNPQQNPYIWNNGSGWQWTHSNASPYVDRTCGDPHVVVRGDECYNIFTKYGFGWGGDWENPIDYQHFEKTINE